MSYICDILCVPTYFPCHYEVCIVIPFSKITESRVYYGAYVYSIVILEIIVKISMENSFFYVTIINKRDEIYC